MSLPPWSQPILTAAQMRAAEDRAIAAGTSVQELMERAGSGVAQWVHRLAAGAPVLVLCGPGNNGGDGYVAARNLREQGVDVRVCALSDPRTEAAIEARRRWDGPVEDFPAEWPEPGFSRPVLVDALFGTGATRPLEHFVSEVFHTLVIAARLSIAVDLPSGMNSDCGGERASIDHPDFDITLALGALKPAHALYPAAQYCGAVQVIDIGLGLDEVPDPDENVSPDQTIGSEWIVPSPSCWDHKYSRGMVVLLGGAMPGATALAAEAALRAGAGYALLLNDQDAPAPSAIVQKRWSPDALVSAVQGRHRAAILAGPGLGRDAAAAEKIEAATRCIHPLVLDGDALHLIGERHFAQFHERRTLPGNHAPVILTPHVGEFEALFGAWTGSKIEAARAAAIRSGAIVVFKGPDTVVAHPDGTTNTASGGSPWLSTAGTGDVLAGIIAALVTQGVHFSKVEAAVWLHGEAARRLGPAFIADDLAGMISAVRASL